MYLVWNFMRFKIIASEYFSGMKCFRQNVFWKNYDSKEVSFPQIGFPTKTVSDHVWFVENKVSIINALPPNVTFPNYTDHENTFPTK